MKKKCQVKKDTKWRNHHLEDIIKDTSRNEISIETRKKKDIELPKERVVPNKPCPLQSFMMAQVPKRYGLPSTNTHLKWITRLVFYRK